MTGSTGAHRLYVGKAGREYHEGKRGLPPEALPWLIRLRASRFQPFIRPTDPVFEFGVGAGWNLAGLHCGRRVGHDVERHLGTGSGCDAIEFTPDCTALPSGGFEVILCHHALEHVDEPARVLLELRRLAAAGGTLLLAVPYEFERRYRRFDPAEPNRHLYAWNVQTLGQLLTLCGWSVQKIGLARYGYDRFAAAWAVRLRLGERGFRGLRTALQWLRPLREIAVLARHEPAA